MVAKRHNTLLGADDPIFMTVTLNELILERALNELSARILASQDQISAGSAQYLAASKALGERLVTAATEHMLQQLREATAEAADALKATARAELAPLRDAAKKVASIRTGAWWALILAVATIAATLTLIAPQSLTSSNCQLTQMKPGVQR